MHHNYHNSILSQNTHGEAISAALYSFIIFINYHKGYLGRVWGRETTVKIKGRVHTKQILLLGTHIKPTTTGTQ